MNNFEGMTFEKKVQYAGGPAGTGGEPPRKKKSKKLTVALIILAVLAVVLLFCIGVAASSSNDNETDTSYPYVGELYIEGTIGLDDTTYNQQWILDQINGMKESSSNKGLLLYVNSPGGAVYQGDEIYNALKAYQKETGRPIYSYFAEYAASGGYYISALSDYIGANRFCTTGSIGVYYGPMYDISGLMEKAGVNVDIIKSGSNKAMGSEFFPLTEEQRQIYQKEVDEIYDIFVGIVAEGRDLKEDYVRQIADGRPYTASEALKLKLIDQVCSLKDIEEKICSDTGIEDINIYRYQREETLIERLIGVYGTVEQLSEAQNKSESQKLLEYLSDEFGKESGYMMLLQR